VVVADTGRDTACRIPFAFSRNIDERLAFAAEGTTRLFIVKTLVERIKEN